MNDFINIVSENLYNELLSEKVSAMIYNFLIASITMAIFIFPEITGQITFKFFQKYKLDITTSNFVLQIVKYIILIIALISSLNKLGINTTAVLTSLGVLGLTVGFAAKDTLSNIISGIFIFWDRPFVLEDLVDIGGQYGKVSSITLRSTRIVTPDGKMIAIPNSSIINERITSYTNFPNLRIDIPVTIGLNENINQVRELLTNLIKEDTDYLENPQPKMVVAQLNDYNIQIELRAWLKDEKRHIEKRFELREKIFETLRSNNIEMPYETIQLTPLEFVKHNNIN